MLALAHLSDLHLDGSGLRAATARRALRHRTTRAADLVIITGDLTAHGAAHEFESADFLGGALVLPGNRDTAQGAEGWWARCPLPPRAIALGPDDDPWPVKVPAGDGWWVFGLDSTRGGVLHGRLGDTQLRRLDEALKVVGGQHAIIAMHHHPAPRRGIEAIEDHAQLARLLEHHAVPLVLHGHGHKFGRRPMGATVALCAPATTLGCGLTGQRFFLDVRLERLDEATTLTVSRVQYAPPADWRGLSTTFRDVDDAQAWVTLAERAYDADDTFDAFSTEIEARATRLNAIDQVSADLDQRLAALLAREDT